MPLSFKLQPGYTFMEGERLDTSKIHRSRPTAESIQSGGITSDLFDWDNIFRLNETDATMRITDGGPFIVLSPTSHVDTVRLGDHVVGVYDARSYGSGTPTGDVVAFGGLPYAIDTERQFNFNITYLNSTAGDLKNFSSFGLPIGNNREFLVYTTDIADQDQRFYIKDDTMLLFSSRIQINFTYFTNDPIV